LQGNVQILIDKTKEMKIKNNNKRIYSSLSIMTNHVIPIYIVSELMLQCTNGVGFDPAEGRTILHKKKLSTANTVSCEMLYHLGSTNKLFPE
jgi:hypothetical protein